MKAMISKSKRALSVAVVMTVATVCAAQAPKPASKGLVIKGKAPISKAAAILREEPK